MSDSTQDTRRSPVWDLTTPTDNADEETKNNFYSSLPPVLENIPKHDVTWLMVDFSARVGQEKSDGSTGSRLYHIQHRHQRLRGKWRHIVIGGTLFAHKDLSSIRWEHRPHHEQQQMKAISIGLPISVGATTLLLQRFGLNWGGPGSGPIKASDSMLSLRTQESENYSTSCSETDTANPKTTPITNTSFFTSKVLSRSILQLITEAM